MRRMTRIATMTALIAASASAAGAQASTSLTKPISIGISGGVAMPSGELSNGSSGGFTGVNTGYNVTGSLAVALPVLPFEIRGDAAYTGFNSKNLSFANSQDGSYNADARVISFTANIVYPFPIPTPIVRPYIIGGVGDYDVKISPSAGGGTSQSNFGYNLGAGVKVALVGFNAFVEARYHHVNQDQGSVAFTPITVGVMF
jgi:opacity protein-like surface antigen